jgi:hypothetical protein
VTDNNRAAMAAHLKGNFSPPLPDAYVDWALELWPQMQAAALGSGEDWRALVEVPAAVLATVPHPRKMVRRDGRLVIELGDLMNALRLSDALDWPGEDSPRPHDPSEDPDALHDLLEEELARSLSPAAHAVAAAVSARRMAEAADRPETLRSVAELAGTLSAVQDIMGQLSETVEAARLRFKDIADSGALLTADDDGVRAIVRRVDNLLTNAAPDLAAEAVGYAVGNMLRLTQTAPKGDPTA